MPVTSPASTPAGPSASSKYPASRERCVRPHCIWNVCNGLANVPPVKSFLSYEDASAWAAGRDPPSTSSNAKPARFYGVAVGRKPGVYTDWPTAQEAFVGWKGPKYKKFDTRAEAEAFVRSFGTAAKAARLEHDGDEVDGVEEPPAKKAKTVPKPVPTRNGVDVVYTDGSSLGNGRVGATAGVGVFFGESDPRFVFYLHT